MQIKPFPIGHVRQIEASKSGGCSCKPRSIAAGITLTKPSEKNLTTPHKFEQCDLAISLRSVFLRRVLALSHTHTLWCLLQSTANSGSNSWTASCSLALQADRASAMSANVEKPENQARSQRNSCQRNNEG